MAALFAVAAGAAAWTDGLVAPLAAATGLGVGEVKLVAGLVLAIPLGALVALPCRPVLRHALSALAGGLMTVGIFGPGGANLLVSVTFTYLCMAASRKACGAVVFVGAMAYLVYLHSINASGTAWQEGNIDFTGSQMVITAKLTMAALNYADGGRPDAELSDFQREKRLVALPTVLEFFGYALNPTQILVGPACEMSDYLAWVRNEGVYAKGPPGRALPTLRAVGTALACVGVFLFASPHLPMDAMTSAEWGARPLWWRIAWLFAFMFVFRAKYYFSWKMAEAAVNASGLGYSGEDEAGRAVWDRGTNVNVLGVELATSAALLPIHWNIRTGLWLRHYVYERLTPKGKKAPFHALLITQLVSGVWHGLYAGYWLFFGFSAFMIEASKAVYRHERRLTGVAKALGKVAHWFLAILHVDYLGMTFVLLETDRCLAAWKNIGYVGHATIFGLLALGYALPAPKTKRAGAPSEAKKDK